jgi:hypothetical protein
MFNAPKCVSLLIASCLGCQFCNGQESRRDLNDDPAVAKFLTYGQVDQWKFEGKKDETVVVKLTTTEFDAVVGISEINGDNENILFSTDDEGSGSQFKFRLPKDGTYIIRVHAFKMQGGGNYNLQVGRYQSRVIEIGQTVSLKLDKKGKSSFCFQSSEREYLVFDLPDSVSHRILDPNGNEISCDWYDSILTEHDGEYLVEISGVSQRQYQVTVKRAIYNDLDFTGSRSVKNKSKNLYVWQFDTDQFEFKRLFVTRNQNVNSRVVFAPPKQDLDRLFDQRPNAAPLMFLPVAAKGPRQFYDVNFNRNGRYQLQVFVDDIDEFEIGSIQPTQAVHDGQNRESKLPIGDCDYYSFEATPCELIEVSLDSEAFDSLLRLYNERGIEIASNDDINDTTNSRISFLITDKGRYRLQVSSLGNGGGGSYNLEFNRIKFKQLELNSRASGEVERAQADYWTFEAKKVCRFTLLQTANSFNLKFGFIHPVAISWRMVKR